MDKRKPVIEVDEKSRKCYYCAGCRKVLLYTMNGGASGCKYNYCPDCGQGIDWGGIVFDTYFPM